MIKKYFDFITEAEDQDNISSNSSSFDEVKDAVKSLIESTIDNSGGEYNSFIESFLKNPNDVKIEGLINDSDVYDFYLKWRNEIDELLNSIKYFDEVPTKNNSFGLYEYVIKGTQRAVEEVVKILK
jgi:hypothetical protein